MMVRVILHAYFLFHRLTGNGDWRFTRELVWTYAPALGATALVGLARLVASNNQLISLLLPARV
jgi:hypothetical protein